MGKSVRKLSIITADHPSLVGHFPGDPVVPGVVLLEKVVQLLQQWQPDFKLKGLAHIKFLLPLRPNEEFMISLTQTKTDCVKFECIKHDKQFARGILKLESFP